MTAPTLISKLNNPPTPANLWDGEHKIPWNDPAFSRRMLKEHLTQDHDLASRKAETIAAQTQWIHEQAMNGAPGHILDLGCGPGLYAPHLANMGHRYLGLDFGPASIEHAKANHARNGQVRFQLGDVTEADYGGPHDLAYMLYGEINVFAPMDMNRILTKAYGALLPGGRILLEAHTFEAVRTAGEGQSWYATEAGLFSEEPHICLTANHWFEELNVSRQDFHVLGVSGKQDPDHEVYHSTMQAWTREDYARLLQDAGFMNVAFHDDWPGSPDLLLVTAMK